MNKNVYSRQPKSASFVKNLLVITYAATIEILSVFYIKN